MTAPHPAPGRRASPQGQMSASDLIVRSRLAVPRATPPFLHRRRLLDLLLGAEAPLVLLSAPAGSGKSALAAEWARSGDNPREVAWVDCHEDELDLWDSLLVGVSGSPNAGPGRAGLPQVVEAVDRADRPLTVVLDGYQVRSLEVAHELDLLLRCTEGRLRLVLTTRVDPVLPLHRYRLGGDLVEIRVADLAFTDEEAEHLLHAGGVELTPAGVSALNERLSGWAAGLRFAIPVLAGHPDPDQLVSTAVTYNGDINAFLLGEVLDVQSPRVRELLLVTSVPDVLTPDLLETLSGEPAAPAALELARSNVFLETQPGPGSCLRYVPFFRDLLRAQFAYESPDRMVQVHRSAASWYAAHGMWDHVATHLAGAGDWDGVADLFVERLLLGRLLVEGPEGRLLAVARALRTASDSPALHLTAAAVALHDHDPGRAAEHLSEARSSVRWAAKPEAAAVLAAALDAVVAVGAAEARAGQELAARADELLEGHPRSSGQASGADLAAVVMLTRARAALRLGAVAEARALLEAALAGETAARSPSYRADCLVHLAVLEARRGAVGRAGRLAEEALGLGDDGHHLTGGLSPRRSTAHLAAAYVALEQDDLDRVHDHLAVVGSQRDPVWQVVLEVVTAAAERAAAQPAGAAARLDRTAGTAAFAGPWLAEWVEAESRRAPGGNGPGGASSSRMVEPLTPRELEVLVCMSQWLTTDEIAENLFVSVNTVRTHVRNILTKMGVSRRNAAIREGFRLGLLDA